MTDLETLEQKFADDLYAADAAIKAGREPPPLRGPEEILGREPSFEESWLALSMLKAWAQGCFDSSKPRTRVFQRPANDAN